MPASRNCSSVLSRWLACAVLMCAGCPSKPPPPPPPDPPAKPAEPEIQRPSGPYSPAEVLKLSPELMEKIRALESTAADPERLCESVERATSLRHTLGAALSDRYRAVEGTPDEAAFSKSLDGVTDGLIGIGAGVRGGVVSTWLQLPQLHHPKPARDVLTGASEFLGTYDPVYVNTQSEARVCAELGAAERPLHLLAEGWAGAPECVRLALAEDLADVVTRVGDVRCFCSEKTKALSEVGLIAPVLEQLTELDGPVAAEELRTGANGPDAVYGGQCLL